MHPFVESPWRILLLDTKRSNPNHYLCLALRDALRVHPRVAAVELVNYGSALAAAARAVDGGGFDLFLAFDGEEMDEALCASAARLCRRSALWVTEDPYERTLNVHRARLFDLVLTNDSASVGAYSGRARHLPLAASEAWHFYPAPAADGAPHRYLHDVFFAGTAWPNRSHFLRELTVALPDLRYKIALPANEHLPRPDLIVQRPASSLKWRTPNAEFCRLANLSRITLGLHRDFSGGPGNPSRAATPGPRLFETALAGGFQLVDGTLTEISDFYSVGADLDVFTATAEAVAKVRQHLADPGPREAMARTAQRTTRERHLYAHRVDRLLDWAAEIPPRAIFAPPAVGEDTSPRRRRLLYVAHSTTARGHFGGVEVVMDLLARELHGEFEIFSYVSTCRDRASVGAVLYGPEAVELRRFDFPPLPEDAFLTCPAREAAFAQTLRDCAIDLVHYHHFIGHVPSLPFVSRAYGVPGTLTVYDYYPVCASFNLLNYDRRFCRIEDLPIETCDVCLSALFDHPAGSQSRRRAFFGRVFDALDAVIFISEDTRKRTQRLYPSVDFSRKTLVTDLPVPYHDRPAHVPPAARWSPGAPQVVSFGNFTQPKGADVMLRAFNQLRDSRFEFHLYGRLDEPYPVLLQALNFPNLRVHQRFSPGSLHEVLARAALSLHVSIWPETFCITVAEAMHFGVVPIVSDLGAPGERIEHGVNGFKVPPDSPGPLVELLRGLEADHAPAVRCAERLAAVRVHDAAQHGSVMRAHYHSLLARTSALPHAGAAEAGALRADLTRADCGPALANPSWCLSPPLPVAAPVADASGIGAANHPPGGFWRRTARRAGGWFKPRGPSPLPPTAPGPAA